MYMPWSNARQIRRAADAARDRRQWRKAARLYRKYLGKPGHQDDAAIWVQLGHACKEAGDFKAASDAYQRSLTLEPMVADTYLQLGHLLKISGQPHHALAAYRQALCYDSGLKDARREHDELAGPAANLEILAAADAARDAGHCTDARLLYARCLSDPAHATRAEVWMQLGHAAKDSGYPDEALGAYRRAIELAPNVADHHLQLGHLFRLMGASTQARDAYHRALALDPECSDARSGLASLVEWAVPPLEWHGSALSGTRPQRDLLSSLDIPR